MTYGFKFAFSSNFLCNKVLNHKINFLMQVLVSSIFNSVPVFRLQLEIKQPVAHINGSMLRLYLCDRIGTVVRYPDSPSRAAASVLWHTFTRARPRRPRCDQSDSKSSKIRYFVCYPWLLGFMLRFQSLELSICYN